MPSTGTPSDHTTSAARGAFASRVDSGEPDSTMPLGAKARISASDDVPGMNLGIDAELAHAARDQLRVLGPEVEDQDLVVMDVGHRR